MKTLASLTLAACASIAAASAGAAIALVDNAQAAVFFVGSLALGTIAVLNSGLRK